jgi:peptide deformylase
MTNSDSSDPIELEKFQLVYVPHQALDRKTDSFPEGNPAWRIKIAQHMGSLMTTHKGIGLAANQINLNYAVHVQMIQNEMVAMFNPQVHEVSDDLVLMSEGCLSDPGLSLKVKRPDMIKASWEDEQGVRTDNILYGMDCRVFLHEFDHLQGVMFTDRVGKTKLQLARKKQAVRMERAAQRIIANMSL